MRLLKSNIYCADFETTGYQNLKQDGEVRVWLWSLINVETKQAWNGKSIRDFYRPSKT